MPRIDCFSKSSIPGLKEKFDSQVTEDMSEQQQRDIGTKIALEYHKQLHEEVASLRKSIGSKVASSTYVSPDKSAEVDKINKNYEGKLSGIKKALVPDEKVDATPIERRNNEQMLASAKEDVDAGKIDPKAIVQEIAKGNARALQPDEVAALVYHKAQLDKEVDAGNQELLDAMDAGDTEAQARAKTKIDALNQEIDDYHTMAVKTAYEQSLAFRMRQMLLDNEYNLQSQILKYKAANNGVIAPDVEAKFKALDRQLKETTAKLRKLEDEQSKANATESLKSVRTDLQKQKEHRLKIIQERKGKINDFFDSLKVKADPNKLNSITQVIGESVWNGSVEVMRQAVLAGSDVATAIKAGIEYVKEHYHGNDFDEDNFSKTVQPGIERIVPTTKEASAKPTIKDGQLKIPGGMIADLVASGVDNITDVTEQIHSLVKETLPDVTIREVRDAITRYGITKQLSQDDIKVKIREIKRVGRLISGLEDVQNQQRPLRSGLQRDKPTDEERRLQKQIKEAMKDLPIDEAEDEQAWRNALDQVKARLKNQISDLETQIETGEKTEKSKRGIEYDAEATALKEERDRLKEIVQQMEGRPEMSDEQKIRRAIAGVEKTIKEYERRISEHDFSSRKASDTPETDDLKQLRAKRDALKSTYSDMEKEAGIAEQKRLANYKKALQRSADQYETRLKAGDFVREKKKPVELDAEATQLKLERDKIKQEFDVAQEKARLANRPLSQKIWDTVIDVWNIPKSLKSTLDMSAPFRQGAILSISNPREGVAAFLEMWHQAFSEKRANEWLLLLKESPGYAVMRQSKLYIAEPTAKLTAKEESFISNLAGKIPLIGPPVKASERAYTGYLNKLRVDIFVNGADRLRENGFTPENNPEAYKAWANFINNATGRGNLGGAEMAAPLLNTFLFAPRYVVSRVNILLNPVMYKKLPKPVRIMAIKSVLAWMTFNVLFMTLVESAFGDHVDIEWDPRSSDFGKIRVGNIRFDLWAGEQQLVRNIAQITTGQRKSNKTGKIMELSKDKFPYDTRLDVFNTFIRSKLSPSAGTIVNILDGENIVGEETTIKSEVLNLTAPLYPSDIVSMYKEEGPTGLALTMLPAFFGVGVQSYGEKHGVTNKEIDPKSEIHKLNSSRKYSVSQPSKGELTESFDHDVDDDTFDKFYKLRDQEMKRLFDRYQFKLENTTDIEIYDKMMDSIVKESGREAKYQIAREKGWDFDGFKPGNRFKLKKYKKNAEGKVVEAKLFAR